MSPARRRTLKKCCRTPLGRRPARLEKRRFSSAARREASRQPIAGTDRKGFRILRALRFRKAMKFRIAGTRNKPHLHRKLACSVRRFACTSPFLRLQAVPENRVCRNAAAMEPFRISFAETRRCFGCRRRKAEAAKKDPLNFRKVNFRKRKKNLRFAVKLPKPSFLNDLFGSESCYDETRPEKTKKNPSIKFMK